MNDLYRVCVKLYAHSDQVPDDAFVPIFHEWIRNRRLDLVAIDVADYAHVPASPGMMLVAHEVTFALDRGDGRFGLLAQRRRPIDGGATQAIAVTLRQARDVASRLESDRRLRGRLSFDQRTVRVEANDRLRAPNTRNGFEQFMPFVKAAAAHAFDGAPVTVQRVLNDSRDRLAVDVTVE